MRLVDDLTISVLATCNVLGMWAGGTYDVYPTARVEKMIKWGHLIWLDEPQDDYRG